MEIKGVAVKTIPKYVELKFPEVFNQWLNEIPQAAKELFESSVLVSKWYDVDVFVRRPIEALSKLVFIEPPKLAWDMGRFSAKDALSGIYKFFLRFGGPVQMIKRIPFFFENYYRPANVEILELDKEKRYAKIKFPDFSDPNDVILNRIAGWGEQTLHEAGAEIANLKIRTENNQIILDIYWQ